MFNKHDIKRNEFMLHGPLAHNGFELVDEIRATHIGCEYGEYGDN